MPRRSFSIRWWLASLVLGVALPLTLLLTFLFVEQVRRERTEARESALGVARTVAKGLHALHGDSLALLDGMLARAPIHDFDGLRCDSLFAITDFFPQYLDLILFDASGNIVCSGAPQSSDLALATAARKWIAGELRSGRLHRGVPLVSSISDHWISAVSQPVNTSFHGTLVLLALPEIIERQTLPRGSVMTILDQHGTIVVRSDNPRQWIGRDVSGSMLTATVLSAREGVTEARGVDGVSRQYGFTSIPDLGWSVYVGIPTSVVMTPVRAAIARGLVGGTMIVLVLVAAALIMSRKIGQPIDALARAAASVSKGGYARVQAAGPREIAMLAGAFNEMVESRSRAEKQTQESEESMKALSDRLLVAQEEERTRIAREIHDDLGQVLTALKMDVIGLMDRMGEHNSPIRERVLRTLDTMVTAVQRISSELRPSILDDLGLIAAIDSEARAFEERTGIECDVSIPESLQIDSPRATAIFRIIQEALTNVARHSNAARVELRVRPRETELLIEIRDDGRGITSQEIGSTRSFGLIGIRERAAVVGGTVRFEGVASRGTIVSVRIPLTSEATRA